MFNTETNSVTLCSNACCYLETSIYMTHLHGVRHAVFIIAVIELGEQVLTQLEKNAGILTVNKKEKHMNQKTIIKNLSHFNTFLINKFRICFSFEEYFQFSKQYQ